MLAVVQYDPHDETSIRASRLVDSIIGRGPIPSTWSQCPSPTRPQTARSAMSASTVYSHLFSLFELFAKQDNVQANAESIQCCLYMSSFEILDVKFWWPLIRTVQGHLRSKVMVSIDSPWVISYSTSIDSHHRICHHFWNIWRATLWPRTSWVE